MSCPRNRKTCRGTGASGDCVGCRRDATRRVEERQRELTKAYCNIKRTDGWPCDRPPHEGNVHRNMVLGEMWLGTPHPHPATPGKAPL